MKTSTLLCDSVNPYDPDIHCDRPLGHDGFHRSGFARWGSRGSGDNHIPSICDYNHYRDYDHSVLGGMHEIKKN